MTTYRLYLLDARGHVTWGEWFEAEGPEAAAEVARTRSQGGVSRVEVWLGAARVYSYPPAAAEMA